MSKKINLDARIEFRVSSKQKENFLKACESLREDKSKILREMVVKFNIEYLHLIQEQEESEGE